jgi:5,10-methylenetetrahydromethanopterin reductase
VALEIAGCPVGMTFIRGLPARDMAALSAQAESAGFESVWVAEHSYGRDAITPLAAIACATERVRIGAAVVPIFTRTALLLASTWATLDELASGRLVIGLGAGSRLLIEAQGIEYGKPVTALKENVQLIRALLRDRRASVHGKVVHHEGVELDFEPLRPAIPVWLGVTGPRAVETSGEIAEGAMLNSFTSVDYTRSACERIAVGLSRRTNAAEFTTATVIVCEVDDDRKAALDRMRPILAVYLARLPDVAKLSGFDPELIERLRAHVDEGGGSAGAPLVSDEMLDALTACGPASFVRDRVAAYVDAGVTYPILAPTSRWSRAIEAIGR